MYEDIKKSSLVSFFTEQNNKECKNLYKIFTLTLFTKTYKFLNIGEGILKL
jgi:hypothetical protein